MDGVLGEVELAALPCRAAQHRPAGGAQAGVIVRDDILHAAQAARLQALQECAPMDLRFGEGDRDAQHPAALVLADADRREHGGVADDPAVMVPACSFKTLNPWLGGRGAEARGRLTTVDRRGMLTR